MSTSLRVQGVLRVVAAAASLRQPLPQALRQDAGALGHAIAEAIEQGQDLPAAFAAHLPEHLRCLLGGPRPPLDEAALLVADCLEQDRQWRNAWLDAVLHPLFTLAIIPIAIGVILHQSGMGMSVWLTAAGVLGMACAVALLASGTGLGRRLHLPEISSHPYHQRMSWRYERAALVVRWRLTEAQLATLLGDDLEAIIPLLEDPQSHDLLRQLASFHRQSSIRSRERMCWMLAGLLYVTCGLLLLASAVGPMHLITSSLHWFTAAD